MKTNLYSRSSAVNDIEFADSDDGFWAEILRPGTWHGSKGGKTSVTSADLSTIVETFKETYPAIKPVLRIGDHEDKNGSPKPAVGWVSDLKVKGDRLLARFTDVPRVVREAIGRKLFRNVSAGLWREYEVDGKPHEWVLNHVAILGAELPAVNGLADLDAYFTDNGATDEVVVFTTATEASHNRKGLTMTIEELQAKLAEKNEELNGLREENKELKASNEKLTSSVSELKSDIAEFRTKQIKQEVASIVDEAVNDGRLLPKNADAAKMTGIALRHYGVNLSSNDHDPFDDWKAMLTTGGKVVDFNEKGETGEEDEVEDSFESEYEAGAKAAEAAQARRK